MRIKKIILLAIIYITNYCCIAQEVLLPLDYNPAIHQFINKYGINSVNKIVAPDTLSLPFVDDFSEDGIYPSADRWTDNKVFINSDLPRNMPTVGAATFDGLDEYGKPYSPGSTLSGIADVLSSKPIYLHTNGTGTYSLTDSIYLSFYYEKKGYGDAPEVTDSLILEFYNPAAMSWTRSWYMLGGVSNGQDTVFTRVDVLITDPSFLADGFRFRFKSYGNLSGNLDHWHLDYVRLFSLAATGYMNVHDIAFIKSRERYLKNYTSVPWAHYKNTSVNLLPDSTTINFINYGDIPQDIGFNHRSYDIDGTVVGSFGQPLGNIYGPFAPNQRFKYTYPMGYPYTTIPEISSDSNYFDFYDFFSNLGVSNNAIRSNDTIHYRQYFFNYYSYDDGTCEVAYDLVNASGGKVAMRFDILQPDILRGVKIFFAQQDAVVSNKLMTIKVWSSLTPETVIYQQTNMLPLYIDSINGFATYVFNSVVNVPVTFLIGFQQVAPDGLHLGFDRNIANNSRMFSNTSGIWSNVSAAQGTFMIRPFFGDSVLAINEANRKYLLKIYPNPVEDYLKIEFPVEKERKTLAFISDISGRVVYEKQYLNSEIDVSFLKPGVYIFKLEDERMRFKPARFIVK